MPIEPRTNALKALCDHNARHSEQARRKATSAVEESSLYGGTYRKGNGRCLKASVAKEAVAAFAIFDPTF